MAGTYSTYYFDGLNFSTATAIYTDAALTTLAADGFYAQNNIVRQQSNGLLLNAQSCSSCAVACGSGVSASGSNPGYYNADVDVANDTGAVVIYFYMTSSIPDGVIGTFNNVAYNRMTSKYNHNGVTLIDGSGATVDYAGINNTTAVPDRNIATYVGNENNLLVGSYANVAEYNLVNTSYVNLGTTRNITVVNNQVGYADDTSTPTNSPVFTMVIPKAAANATLINIQIFAPMGGTAFDWEVLCPTALPNFQGSNLQADDTCVSNDETYYFSRNATGTSTPFTKDTNTVPEIGNFVFTQPDGSVYANDTSVLQYIIVDSTTALGIRNGVVVSSAACSNTGGFKSFSSSSSTSQSQICDNNSPPSAGQTFYHNGTGVGPGGVYPDTGDTAYTNSDGSTVLPAGTYYLYQDGSGNAHYMVIGLGGSVTIPATCQPPTTIFYISTMRSGCSDFCNANYLINTPRGTTGNDAYANVIIGDVIAGSSLSAGWYAYAASSTNTLSGTFRIMQVDSNNTITSLAECDNGVCQII